MQPGANRHQHRLLAALAQSRSSADQIQTVGVSSAWRGLCAGRSHSGSCAARYYHAARRKQTSTQIIHCTSSNAKRPKIQTDRREQCPAWMMRDAVTREAAPDTKNHAARGKQTSTQIIRCTSSREAAPTQIQTVRREQCRVRLCAGRSHSELPLEAKNHATRRKQTSTQMIAAQSSIAKQR
jgi:hypothetical protein